METSQRMTSGSSRLATATPARPLGAESGWNPSISSIRTRFSSVSGSSSITSIFFMSHVGLGKERKADGESGASSFGAVALDPAAMQRHAALHDEKAEAGPGDLADVAAPMKRL